MRRVFSAVLVTASLAAPIIGVTSASAGEPRVHANITLRIFDPDHHDYHAWDQREERAYRQYLAERHRRYVTYQHQRLAEQRAYWRWRHERGERIEHERS